MTSSRDGKGLSWKIQSPRFASMRSSVVFTVDSENKRDDPRVHIFSVSDGRPRNDRPMDSVRSNHSHNRRLPQEVAPSSSLRDELKEITFREFEVVFREVSVFVSPSSFVDRKSEARFCDGRPRRPRIAARRILRRFYGVSSGTNRFSRSRSGAASTARGLPGARHTVGTQSMTSRFVS